MNILISILIGLAAGVAGGFFGIGGAVIIIPLLIFSFGLEQHMAQGTALMALVPPIGLLAALRYYHSGNVKVAIALFVALGFLFGGLIGAHFAHKIDALVLKRVFGVFLLFVALKMIIGK